MLRRTGRVDVLVNSAGIAGRAAPLWEQTERGLYYDDVFRASTTARV